MTKWVDLFGIDPDYTDGKPVDQWLHEQRTGHHDEQAAFEHVVTYHYRAASDRCACGELPLGSSFATHLWDEFSRARMTSPMPEPPTETSETEPEEGDQ